MNVHVKIQRNSPIHDEWQIRSAKVLEIWAPALKTGLSSEAIPIRNKPQPVFELKVGFPLLQIMAYTSLSNP